MRIDVLTLFPEMFEGMFSTSIIGKAREKGIVTLNAINFREFSGNKHNTVDDYPYGGGGGMVLKAEPIFNAVEHVVASCRAGAEAGAGEYGGAAGGEAGLDAGLDAALDANAPAAGKPPRVVLMCPQGETYTQKKAEAFAAEDHLILICGHYEGYDERIREHLVTDEISIGDFVLTGGEIAACVVIDSVTRLLPGALGNELSSVTDSYSTGLLEHPHYTRPAEFRGWKVPDVLISGHHVNVAAWRREQSLYRTWLRRPDLLERAELSDKERALVRRWEEERERS
ncbi:tRNA (guanosine(37)-N1)-methyltransferase TrmD [Paenibacillus sp.]|uniref:tRNA (guanosine(37)-N1)-methyltransferase TrmD n=1 Tax=Paenibacillus sp. TaxID=58172 RepID=UPI002D4B0DB7|nr:tRNA (guanosine(37)-N1)-methyltransferase TrmD [Paenibacillus sp.]HZG58684.1 tRNA (guanosine(37)-N1)-methyltransferase TrmD [Paenibacillus sp.]